ncbi:hypothetical protein Tco_0996269 [Tanacetum coccineum]
MIEPKPMKKLSKKDQVKLDEEVAQRLQAGFDEQERIEREKAEANIALKETWDDIQAKIEADQEKKETLCSKKSRREKEQTTNKSSTKEYHVYLSEKHRRMEAQRFEEQVFCYSIREQIKRVGRESRTKSIKRAEGGMMIKNTKLKSLMEVILDEEEVAVDAIPLATKPPSIVD